MGQASKSELESSPQPRPLGKKSGILEEGLRVALLAELTALQVPALGGLGWQCQGSGGRQGLLMPWAGGFLPLSVGSASFPNLLSSQGLVLGLGRRLWPLQKR